MYMQALDRIQTQLYLSLAKLMRQLYSKHFFFLDIDKTETVKQEIQNAQTNKANNTQNQKDTNQLAYTKCGLVARWLKVKVFTMTT